MRDITSNGFLPGASGLLQRIGRLILPGICALGMCFLLPLCVSASPAVSFEAASNYATLTNPRGLVVSDFNGDGHPDVAVTNYGSAKVSVFLGSAAGSLSAKVDYIVGSGPCALTAADFNQDGKQDLAVPNYSSATASILLGNGDGTFQPKTDYSVGTSPSCTAAGDFNNDGILDLVVGNYSSNNISRLLGNGDGTFQDKVNYAVTRPMSLVAADLNNDGKLDLGAASYSTAKISRLLGNGNGTFQAKVDYPVGVNPYSIAAGDLNKDGILDLVTANYTSHTVSALLGTGDGSFQPRDDYHPNNNPRGIAISDFNGDGNPDVAVSNYSSYGVSILLGDGEGTLPMKCDAATAGNPFGIASADFNGDGNLDLSVANYGSNRVSILLNRTPGELYQLNLSGVMPDLFVGGGDLDLNSLTLEGIDQWGETYSISGLDAVWSVEGDKGGIVDGHYLSPLEEGEGKVYAAVEGVASNALDFKVLNMTEAGLINLSVDQGNLDPAFSTAHVAYQVQDVVNTDSISVTAVLADPDAELTIAGHDAENGIAEIVELDHGANLIPVVITAPNGEDQRAYVISINGTVSDNDLEELWINASDLDFDSDIDSYTLEVAADVDIIELNAMPSDNKAIMLFDGGILDSGQDKSILLQRGSNVIEIMVIAQDASTKTYTITVNRGQEDEIDSYTVTPIDDPAYTGSPLTGSMAALAVEEQVSGLTYFSVNISPVAGHVGDEVVVFVHYRDGRQININCLEADFDVIHVARAGFNVRPGDVIQVYIIDELTNDSDFNPTPL